MLAHANALLDVDASVDASVVVSVSLASDMRGSVVPCSGSGSGCYSLQLVSFAFLELTMTS